MREVHQSFNRFDDTSDKAHHNIVFAWQSGHRPLQRGITYSLDGAFPTKLQPQLLDLYKWTSTKWHEFLHLPSKLASSSSSKQPDGSSRLAWLQIPGTQAQTEGPQRQKRKRDDEVVAVGYQDSMYTAGYRSSLSPSPPSPPLPPPQRRRQTYNTSTGLLSPQITIRFPASPNSEAAEAIGQQEVTRR